MTRRAAACLLVILAVGSSGIAAPAVSPGRVIGPALVESRAWDRLAWLCDRIGHRLSGSPALERAVDWAAGAMRSDGLDRVWTEPVMVPHWVRGEAVARVVAPAAFDMAVLALGGSVATPTGGIDAEVVEVDSFDALEALGPAVTGKIVLFNKPMEVGGYGSNVGMRVRGPARAAEHGAVATLVRSLGTADYHLPHTGALRYEDGVREIPAAAIAAEDAARIGRLLASGETVRVQLELSCKRLPDAASANVLGEIRGSDLADEIVLIGAHLDTWDVGQGAHDDGAGCVTVMETMRQIRRLGVTPRRTVRAVLFTNEENGLRGGRDYAERHGDERHVVAIESDSGGFAPTGFGVTAGEGGVALVERLAVPLVGIGAAEIVGNGGGADIGPLRRRGVPVMSLRHDTTRYFDYHHTTADTLDKVDRGDLDRGVAALTWMTWSLANAEATLPAPPPSAEP